MRRTRRGSLSRLAARFPLAARLARPLGPAAMCVALLACTPGLATADPGGSTDTLGSLIADVAKADQRLQDVGAEIQTEEESVNKALVDVETARDNAAAAQHDVEVSRQAVKDANTAISVAQQRFNTFAAATYVNGPSDGYLTAHDPDDIIATAIAGRTLAVSSQRVQDNLQRARTEQVNRESAARLAKQRADKAAADAQSR
ncbi:MAG: peptidase M23, partial [Mycobacterium sp.]|nr:peptidase M23 [Mycobacterium sp.]